MAELAIFISTLGRVVDLARLSYPTILKYVHSYETIKEDLRQEVVEMLAPHTKPLKELIYDALDECSDKTPSEISDELHLDLTQTNSNYLPHALRYDFYL